MTMETMMRYEDAAREYQQAERCVKNARLGLGIVLGVCLPFWAAVAWGVL